jgi:hypothetical protein
MKRKLFLAFIFGETFLLSTAQIIHVPADQPTIQAGIDAAGEGDTVLVQPGTYIENVVLNGKNIIVASLFLTTQDTSYISQTLIDGNKNGPVLYIQGCDTSAFICGFTITNGESMEGAGVDCSANITLENLLIVGNRAVEPGWGMEGGWGGGLRINGCPILRNIIISGNNATD